MYRELHGNLSLRSVMQTRVDLSKVNTMNKEENINFLQVL